MTGVNVKSEIKPLKKVLLHRPGEELLNLTPETLEELLFDDIPFLEVAANRTAGLIWIWIIEQSHPSLTF